MPPRERLDSGGCCQGSRDRKIGDRKMKTMFRCLSFCPSFSCLQEKETSPIIRIQFAEISDVSFSRLQGHIGD